MYNNCHFGTYGNYFHLKSCFQCCVVLNFPDTLSERNKGKKEKEKKERKKKKENYQNTI